MGRLRIAPAERHFDGHRVAGETVVLLRPHPWCLTRPLPRLAGDCGVVPTFSEYNTAGGVDRGAQFLALVSANEDLYRNDVIDLTTSSAARSISTGTPASRRHPIAAPRGLACLWTCLLVIYK